MLTWPHDDGDWSCCLDQVEQVFLTVVGAVSRYEKLLVVYRDPDHLTHIQGLVSSAGIPLNLIRWGEAPADDAWARDHGPMTVLCGGRPLLLDFTFDGWGGKYSALLDNGINAQLQQAALFGDTPMHSIDLVLEGGAVETDGRGTLLLHERCLLDPLRNPGINRIQIESMLARFLGARRFLWLNQGALAGDDTDSHIDTLARFGDERTILYQGCSDQDDMNFEPLRKVENQLRGMMDDLGAAYRLVELPSPKPILDRRGRRLPAGYTNFLIINGAVLLPIYDDPADSQAMETVAVCFPEREIIPVDCRALILQGGSLHCITMQLPAGVLP